MMEKFTSLALISLLLFCIASVSHSQEPPKLCPVQISTSGTCARPFGISECYHEIMARYGEIPPHGCQCIPSGIDSRICKCNIVCQTEGPVSAQKIAPVPNAANPDCLVSGSNCSVGAPEVAPVPDYEDYCDGITEYDCING